MILLELKILNKLLGVKDITVNATNSLSSIKSSNRD